MYILTLNRIVSYIYCISQIDDAISCALLLDSLYLGFTTKKLVQSPDIPPSLSPILLISNPQLVPEYIQSLVTYNLLSQDDIKEFTNFFLEYLLVYQNGKIEITYTFRFNNEVQGMIIASCAVGKGDRLGFTGNFVGN